MVGLGLSLAICFQMQWAIGENQVILYSILVYLELLIKPVFTLSEYFTSLEQRSFYRMIVEIS